MASRHLPVHPHLDQLKHQAKDLLRGIHAGLTADLAELAEFHPCRIAAVDVKFADAQLVLARAYGVPSWPRLVLACQMTGALQKNDLAAVRALILEHPELIHEDARGTKGSWGPPMSYAANLGHDALVRMLAEMGAQDLQHAFARACLQGKVATARWLLERGARPERGAVMGSCETQNADGLKLLLDLGAELSDAEGNRLAPVALLLETYSRSPQGKHACLALCEAKGISIPDTPVMAVHRGRLDLLSEHLQRDPTVINTRYGYRDIYPLALGCHDDDSLGLHGTPLAGTTLLHMAIDFDEWDFATWLIGHGADVNAMADRDAEGFGGHTPLFNAVVSQVHCAGRHHDSDAFARLLLDHGADPHVRATIRKRLRFVDDESMHEFRDVSPLGYGQQFHERRWVGKAVMRLLVERGGTV